MFNVRWARLTAGVGVVINNKFMQYVEDIEPNNDRLMYITLRGTIKIHIIITYQPAADRPAEEKQKAILSEYMKKLQTSGYDHDMRLEILKSIINGWKNILEKDKTGQRPIHRSREFEKEARIKDKSEKKINWYKGTDGKKYD